MDNEYDAPAAEEGATPQDLRGGQPTIGALRALWRERDDRYAANEDRLTEAQIILIRNYRLQECRDLSPFDQVTSGIATEAMTWRPRE